ncbi:unnamed protein product [Closterium sp. NIES-54]
MADFIASPFQLASASFTALYNAVVARYSSPVTAALGRLLLPYLFPELSAFATVQDLVFHLRTSDTRYRATVPAEFLHKNQLPMFITLYFIVTYLSDSLRSVRDHFLSRDPTSLIVDLLKEHLLAAETSVVAVGAARGTPCTPFFEGCSPSPLASSYASAAAADVPGTEGVAAASVSTKRRSGKGKGRWSGGGGSGGGGGGSSGGGGGSGGGGSSGSSGGSVSVGGGGGGSGGSGSSRSGGSGGGRTGAQRGEALHTLTLDSGASRCFFCDSATLTPLPTPVPVRLADPSGGPVVARSSTVLPCPAVPSGSLSGLHLPLFSTNLVTTAALQDAMVTTTTPGGQCVSICTCTRTGRDLATFTRRLGSSLYTLATEPPQVAASAQVFASCQVAPPCSCRLLSHQNLLWHHRLGHPSLPRLRGMHSRLLVSGLPGSLPPLPPSPAPPCLPCVEGRQRAAPHSSSFPPTTAPLQALHMDVLGPARVTGQGRERYFLLVVDDYTRYTTVFPLTSKGQVVDVLIPWIRAIRGEFSSDLLRDICRGEGILQLITLPDSPQKNGIAERRIGLVMEVARTSMIHVAAPHFLWPLAGFSYLCLRYVRGQALRPRSSLRRHIYLLSPGAGAAGAGGAGDTAGASGTGGTAATGPGGARTRGTGAAGTGGVGGAGAGDPTEPGAARAGGSGAGGTGAEGAGAGGIGAGGTAVGGGGVGGTGAGGAGAVDPGGTVRPRPYFVPLLQQVFEHREPASRPVSPFCTARRVPGSRPPFLPGTHAMALRPSSVPLCVPLLAPPESSLPAVPHPESDLARTASPTVSRLLATVVTDPSFESTAASALVAELLDFAAACRLDNATALVAQSECATPPAVGGECALGTDVLEDRQEDFECLAAAVPRLASMLLALKGEPDAPDILTPRSYVEAITGTYVDKVLSPGTNIVDGMWIFRVKQLPGTPPAFKARYVARGFRQRQGVDYFQTFSPTPKMTTLWLLLHVAAQRDYELQRSLHEEIWLCRPPGFTGSFPVDTQWILRRPVYGLRQAPREWHDTLRTTLVALGFAPSTADPSLFLRTDTSLPPFYVLVYVDDLVLATADTETLALLKSEVQKRHTCTDLGKLRSYLGFQITRDKARRTITPT